MTDPRYDAARAKLRRFLPPPPPDSGWGYARQRIAAYFLGVLSDDQAAMGESMLLMPAVLARTDSAPTSWTSDERTWAFAPTIPSYQGAQGDWLDLWGATLAVPRETGEPDGLYGPRILAELLRPTTTNTGLAQAIDQGMGILGTEVLEAEDVLKIYRLNSPGLRLNSSQTTTTKRLNMAGAFGGNSLSACFIVRVPTGAQQPYDENTIRRLADRRKAAGTRLLGIYTATGGSILAPDSITVGVVNTAYIQPIAGATYAWSVTGGVMDSGQGTNSITFHAASPGQVGLSVLVTLPAGSTNYWKPVTAYSAMNTAIDTGLYQYAGTFRAVAAITPPGPGYTIEWSATGMDLEGPVGGPVVTYDMGVAGTMGALTVTLRNAVGAVGTSTVYIKSIPYTSEISHTTQSLVPGGFEDFSLDLGWQYDLDAMATDFPAMLRVYNTAADRAADAARPLDQDAAGGTPIVFEGATSPTKPSFTMPDLYIGTNGDTPRTKAAYCRIYNTGPTDTSIALTLTRTETRTSGEF